MHGGEARISCHLFSINKQLSSVGRLVPASPTGLGGEELQGSEGGQVAVEGDVVFINRNMSGSGGVLCHSSG